VDYFFSDPVSYSNALAWNAAQGCFASIPTNFSRREQLSNWDAKLAVRLTALLATAN
jgi:hypothetical protein